MLYSNFVKYGRRENGEIVHSLPDKKQFRLALQLSLLRGSHPKYARVGPGIFWVRSSTVCSECAQSALDFSCSVRSHFFCERILNIWNRLPVDSTDFGSLHRFRNSLDAIDDTILVDAQ